MDDVLAWFDLAGPSPDLSIAAAAGMPLAQQLLLYGVVVVGVVFSEAVAMARSGGPVRLDLNRTWLAVACVIALVVFPALWRDLRLTAETSLLVQAGLAAQAGVFWGVLLAGMEKRVGPVDGA